MARWPSRTLTAPATSQRLRQSISSARSWASFTGAARAALQAGAGDQRRVNLPMLPLAVAQAALEHAVLHRHLAAHHGQAGPGVHLPAFPRRVVGLVHL